MANGKVNLTLNITISENWKDTFLSMLKRMEAYSHVGHSGFVGMFADGDGDFRFDVECDTGYELRPAYNSMFLVDELKGVDSYFDNEIDYFPYMYEDLSKSSKINPLHYCKESNGEWLSVKEYLKKYGREAREAAIKKMVQRGELGEKQAEYWLKDETWLA